MINPNVFQGLSSGYKLKSFYTKLIFKIGRTSGMKPDAAPICTSMDLDDSDLSKVEAENELTSSSFVTEVCNFENEIKFNLILNFYFRNTTGIER